MEIDEPSTDNNMDIDYPLANLEHSFAKLSIISNMYQDFFTFMFNQVPECISTLDQNSLTVKFNNKYETQFHNAIHMYMIRMRAISSEVTINVTKKENMFSKKSRKGGTTSPFLDRVYLVKFE
jgi:hypothetical protein